MSHIDQLLKRISLIKQMLKIEDDESLKTEGKIEAIMKSQKPHSNEQLIAGAYLAIVAQMRISNDASLRI